MKSKQRNNATNNSENMLIAILTCSLAPLISHILELQFGTNNGWTTERLLVLYFASVAGYTVSEEIYIIVMKSKWYSKGFKLGNADAVRNVIWMIPVSIVISDYDNKYCVVFLMGLILLALLIIYIESNRTWFSLKELVIILVFIIIIIIIPARDYYSSIRNPMRYYAILFICTLFVALVFDFAVIVYNRITQKKTEGEEAE